MERPDSSGSSSSQESSPDTPNSGTDARESAPESDGGNARPKGSKIGHDVLFAFGPHQSYFMNLRNRWWFHGAKSICDEQDDMELGTPYIVALGPADCFFIAGRSTQNAPVWKYSLPPGSRDRIQIWERSDDKEWALSAENRSDAWNTLKDWISDNMVCEYDQLRQSTVVFGTGNTFYAKTPRGCLWNNLPTDLVEEIVQELRKEGKGAPRQVCLGCNDTWVAFYDDGTYSWNLDTYYDRVHDCLIDERKKNGAITALALDPYSSDYFLHQGNGICCWSVQFNSKVTREIKQRCQSYMQERAREDNATFTLQNWTGFSEPTTKSGYVISPTTRYDMDAVQVANNILSPLPIPESWKTSLGSCMAETQWGWDARTGILGVVAGATLGFLARGRSLFRGWRIFGDRGSINKRRAMKKRED